MRGERIKQGYNTMGSLRRLIQDSISKVNAKLSKLVEGARISREEKRGIGERGRWTEKCSEGVGS